MFFPKKIITKSKEETKVVAYDFAKKILKKARQNKNNAIIIGLIGDLGAGKTTFSQGFAKGLEIKQKIISPTFVILKSLKITKKSKIQNPKSKTNSKPKIQTKHGSQNINFQNFIHIDAYRLENPSELLSLNWKKLIDNPQNIILIEWADKIKKILPENAILIELKTIKENFRTIKIKGL